MTLLVPNETCAYLSANEGREIRLKSHDHPQGGSGMSRKGKAENDTQLQMSQDGSQDECRYSDLGNVSADEQAHSTK